MEIIRKSQSEIFSRDYGELNLLAGNSKRNAKTKKADLKKITINPSCSTSHHFHLERESIFHIESGRLKVTSILADTEVILVAGDTIVIREGEDHFITNVGQGPAILFEVESPPHSNTDKFLISEVFKGRKRDIGRFWDSLDKPRLKICGIKTLDAAFFCTQMHVDAIGIHGVNHDWKTAILMREWIGSLSDNISVFLLTDLKESRIILHLLNELWCDTLQIQGKMSAEEVIDIARSIRDNGFKVIKSIEVPKEAKDISDCERIIKKIEPHLDAILLDSSWRGGSGKPPNWKTAKIMMQTIDLPVILAGGITVNNVEKIKIDLNPYGFDVESGVEQILKSNEKRWTVKDPNKISNLVKKLQPLSHGSSNNAST